ncbi:MAG: oligosaccharide flippase family protein [Desulfobacterales bacterium]|nr:oligosaccharide flippase family protein [Desulfobacterales bacterium]
MLKQKFLVHFGSNFVVLIVSMFAGILVARIAGPGVVGVLAYGTSYIGVWGFATGLFGSGHIKLVSEGQDIGKCMTVYSRLFLGSITVYFIAVTGFFFFQKYVLHVEFESKTQQLVIMLLLFAAIFEKYYQFSSTTFTATMEQAKANLPHFIKSLAWQTGRIVVVFLGFRAVGLATWNLVISFLLLPLVYKLLKKYPRTGWDQQLFKRYVGYAIPILLIVIIDSVIHYSDKLFLAHYTDTIQLGYYSAAYSIGGMVMLVSVSIGNIFFPLFSSLLARHDWNAVKQKIMQYQEFLALFVFPFVCMAFLISGPLLTTVLGAKYEPSIEPFMIIAFATYVAVVGMPYGNTIAGAGRFYLSVWINLIKLAVFALSITFFVAPRFLGLGATGLAFNLLTINIFSNLLYLYFSRRLSKLSYFSFRNISRYVVIFTVALILNLFKDTFNEWLSFWWLVVIPVYLAIVYGMMFALGLVKVEHFKKLADLINFRKVLVYVKGELVENKR